MELKRVPSDGLSRHACTATKPLHYPRWSGSITTSGMTFSVHNYYAAAQGYQFLFLHILWTVSEQPLLAYITRKTYVPNNALQKEDIPRQHHVHESNSERAREALSTFFYVYIRHFSF